MSRRIIAGVGLIVLLGTPGEARSQSVIDLASRCASVGGDATLCARAAGAGRDVAGFVGLLSAPGSDLPGQASTLGRRLGGAPRVAAAMRVGAARLALPSVSSPTGGEASPLVTSVSGTVGLGIFDGISVLPTVGGALSFDVIASGSLVFLPSDRFDSRFEALSVGARVGILRESFTLPALTLSASQRFGGGVTLGDVDASDLSEVSLDPSVTSLRATVGKDLFAFGVMAGAGWDHFSSRTTLRVTDGLAGFTSHTATLEENRVTYFAGVSKQIGVIAWLSAEIGWFGDFDPVSAGAGASPDVGRTFYGNVAMVLKL